MPESLWVAAGITAGELVGAIGVVGSVAWLKFAGFNFISPFTYPITSAPFGIVMSLPWIKKKQGGRRPKHKTRGDNTNGHPCGVATSFAPFYSVPSKAHCNFCQYPHRDIIDHYLPQKGSA